jgi:hypothetical protein
MDQDRTGGPNVRTGKPPREERDMDTTSIHYFPEIVARVAAGPGMPINPEAEAFKEGFIDFHLNKATCPYAEYVNLAGGKVTNPRAVIWRRGYAAGRACAAEASREALKG